MFVPPHQQQQQTILPAETCIEAVIQAGGNTRLAAERLFPRQNNALANLTASIAQDPLATSRLNDQLRTLVTLQAFDTLNATKVGLDMMIAELKPTEYVKFYLALTTVVTSLTAPFANAANAADVQAANPALIAEQLLKLLPPQARRAFMTLVGSGSAVPSPNGGDLDADTTEDYALEHLSSGLADGPRQPDRSSDGEASA